MALDIICNRLLQKSFRFEQNKFTGKFEIAKEKFQTFSNFVLPSTLVSYQSFSIKKRSSDIKAKEHITESEC